MRRLLLTLLGLLVAAGCAYGIWVGLSDDPISRLPKQLQMKPSFYLDAALQRIQQHGYGRATVDWPSVRQHATDMASGAQTIDDTASAIRYALGQLPDHLSLYVPAPPAANAGLGYGVQVLFPERIVATVYPGGAAAKAGIRPGDVVEQVEGHPPMVNHDARTRGAFIELRPPSAVLHVRPPSGESRDVPLDVAPFELLPADTHRIGGDLGYVFLPGTPGPAGFVPAVRSGIAKADAPDVCGWIVDLRRNTGGGMWPMFQSVRAILGEGTLGSFVDAGGVKTAWTYPQDTDGAVTPLAHPMGPVAVLTSRLTAGAAEAVAIAFRGRLWTRSFGEPTWGTPTLTENYPLVDGGMLQLTTAFDADRTGTEYKSRVAPDEPMPIEWTHLGAPDDPMIIAAGTWLRSQAACKKK
jgi:C-terminal processing protease CtpA/Prc